MRRSNILVQRTTLYVYICICTIQKKKHFKPMSLHHQIHSWPKPSLHRIGSFFLASILTLQLQQTTASRKSSSVPLQKKTFKQTELTKPYTTLTCFSYLYSSTCSKTLALCLLVQVLFKTSGPIQEMKYPTKSGLQNNRPSKFEKNANWIELISNVFWRLFDDGYMFICWNFLLCYVCFVWNVRKVQHVDGHDFVAYFFCHGSRKLI